MKKGFLSALALGALAAVSMTPAPATQSTNTKQATQKEQAPQRVRKGQEIVRQVAGGFNVVQVGDGGIPPKIYGTFHVRKGTHKKTNKRK